MLICSPEPENEVANNLGFPHKLLHELDDLANLDFQNNVRNPYNIHPFNIHVSNPNHYAHLSVHRHADLESSQHDHRPRLPLSACS